MKHLVRSSAVVLLVALAGCPPGGQGGKGPDPGATGTVDERLAALRAEITARGYEFEVDHTDAMDRPLSELAAFTVPRDIGDLARRQNESVRDRIDASRLPTDLELPVMGPEQPAQCSAALRQWDWRRAGAVTPVKNQRCGDCWAFSGVAAFESAFVLRNPGVGLPWADGSEPQMHDCSGAGTCSGGFYAGVFSHITTKGLARETDYPTAGGTCDLSVGSTLTPGIGGAWGYVIGNVATGYASPAIATDDEIKAALCQWGPLATTVLATPAFQAYSGGTFNEAVPLNTLAPQDPRTKLRTHAVNHGVLIVGWDDRRRAWLIKNSWGTNWGTPAGLGDERGYMWIRRGANNIGYLTAWVSAHLQIH